MFVCNYVSTLEHPGRSIVPDGGKLISGGFESLLGTDSAERGQRLCLPLHVVSFAVEAFPALRVL